MSLVTPAEREFLVTHPILGVLPRDVSVGLEPFRTVELSTAIQAIVALCRAHGEAPNSESPRLSGRLT
jgi:hypothetical protein